MLIPLLLGINLFDFDLHNALLHANRVRCNINDVGELCVDPTNSPTIGGGFWPAGTTDQYVFNQGLQFAAIIGPTSPAFAWRGDTVGAFFFDERGTQNMGTPLSRLYDALDNRAASTWPLAAYARDTSLFAAPLIGRATVSDQDTWVRYWDGNPAQSNGRVHPAGLLVDQRTMAFRSPALQDVIFFVYRVINISARSPAAYDQLSAAGYDAASIAEIASIGAQFHDIVQSRYNVAIPDAGYILDNAYLALSQDADVGQAGSNYSNGSLVFQAVFAYKSNFLEPTWQFPPDIFGPPFAPAPGFVAEALVRTPADTTFQHGPAGLWMSGNTTSGAPFPAPSGVQRLWRNLSGNLLPSDGTCSFPGQQQARHFCQHVQTSADTRVFMVTGPTSLGPGQSALMIIAQVNAAPVASSPAATPPFGQPLPAFALSTFISGNMSPGFPVDGTRLVQGFDTVRSVDRAAGWLNHDDADGNGRVDPSNVQLVPRSLYWKIRQAQQVTNAGFLQPAAPDAPQAFAVPGDHRVTVVWQPSPSEAVGDPYFALASNPASTLYDPDYRQHDVEGYRVWRGRTPGSLRLLAQFDYAGTSFSDYSGQFEYHNGACAPEIGVTTGCPTLPQPIDVAGTVIQYGIGDRVQLGNGAVVAFRADTLITGGASGLPAPANTGVPFVYVDSAVTNGETWFYAVTAFDANSGRSGFSSLESPILVHAATPRVSSSTATSVAIVTGVYGSDNTALDPSAPWPAIDSATGVFRGIIPPTNAVDFGLTGALAEALPNGEYVATIDSISDGSVYSISMVHQVRMFVTLSAPGATQHLNLVLPYTNHTDDPARVAPVDTTALLVPFDTAKARLLGIALPSSSTLRSQVRFNAAIPPLSAGPAATMLCGRGLVLTSACGGVPTLVASRYLLHSRFWDEGGSLPPDPTVNFNPSVDQNSGRLSGVAAIWSPMPYRTPVTVTTGLTQTPAIFRYYAYGLTGFHNADFVITWGSGGTITVRDSTHRVDLPYARGLGPGYGFIDGAAIAASGVTGAALAASDQGTPNPGVPSYHSLYTVSPVCDGTRVASGLGALPCVPLSKTAVLQGLDWAPRVVDGVTDVSGIVMVIDGEVFFLAMNALPAAGTKWHFQAVGGMGLTATCTPALPTTQTGELATPPVDCSGYAFTPLSTIRAPLIPNLRFKIIVSSAIDTAHARGDLTRVHTVPDPYYLTNSLESGDQRILRFVNLPSQAIVRIYSSSGILVNVLTHNDPAGGGEEPWDLRSRNGRQVASGVYFYNVEAADGQRRTGRFVVVNRQ